MNGTTYKLHFYLFISSNISGSTKKLFEEFYKQQNDDHKRKSILQFENIFSHFFLENFQLNSFRLDDVHENEIFSWCSTKLGNIAKLNSLYVLLFIPRFVDDVSRHEILPHCFIFEFVVPLDEDYSDVRDFLKDVNSRFLEFSKIIGESRFIEEFLKKFGEILNIKELRFSFIRDLSLIVAEAPRNLAENIQTSIQHNIMATLLNIPSAVYRGIDFHPGLRSYHANMSIFGGIELHASERNVFLLGFTRQQTDNQFSDEIAWRFDEIKANLLCFLAFLVCSESILEYLREDLQRASLRVDPKRILRRLGEVSYYVSLLRSPRKTKSFYYEYVLDKLIDNLELDRLIRSAEDTIRSSRSVMDATYKSAAEYGRLFLSLILGTPLYYPYLRGFFETYLLPPPLLDLLSLLSSFVLSIILYYVARWFVWRLSARKLRLRLR